MPWLYFYHGAVMKKLLLLLTLFSFSKTSPGTYEKHHDFFLSMMGDTQTPRLQEMSPEQLLEQVSEESRRLINNLFQSMAPGGNNAINPTDYGRYLELLRAEVACLIPNGDHSIKFFIFDGALRKLMDEKNHPDEQGPARDATHIVISVIREHEEAQASGHQVQEYPPEQIQDAAEAPLEHAAPKPQQQRVRPQPPNTQPGIPFFPKQQAPKPGRPYAARPAQPAPKKAGHGVRIKQVGRDDLGKLKGAMGKMLEKAHIKKQSPQGRAGQPGLPPEVAQRVAAEARRAIKDLPRPPGRAAKIDVAQVAQAAAGNFGVFAPGIVPPP